MDSVGTWSSNGKGCGYDVACSPTYPVRGVCPEGWHLPDTTEWKTLFTAVGGKLTAGKKLKSMNGWNDNSGGTDDFGFSALAAGSVNLNIDYSYEGSLAHFCVPTEYFDDIAHKETLKNDFAYEVVLTPFDDALLDYNLRFVGISVRCVKD